MGVDPGSAENQAESPTSALYSASTSSVAELLAQRNNTILACSLPLVFISLAASASLSLLIPLIFPCRSQNLNAADLPNCSANEPPLLLGYPHQLCVYFRSPSAPKKPPTAPGRPRLSSLVEIS